MYTFLTHIRHAYRGLLRAKGFTLASVVTLALGIGANSAVFSLLHTMVLTPLPFNDAERVVTLWRTDVSAPTWRGALSIPRFEDWSTQNQTFEAMAAMSRVGMNVTGGEQPFRVDVGSVTQDFFKVFSVRPLVGRVLQSEDRWNNHIVVLGEGLWRRAFGGDPTLIGRTIRMDGEGYTVVGILPANFGFRALEAFVPHIPTKENRFARGNNYLLGYGKLKPGVSMDQAKSDMQSVCAAMVKAEPKEEGLAAQITPYRADRFGAQQQSLLLLSVAAGIVLLIACINVANQLLARATGRLREMALRAALGGRTVQVLAPSLAECLLISISGAVVGLLVARITVGLLTPLVPVDLVQAQPLGLHAPTLAMTLSVALLTAMLCGTAPGMLLVRLNLAQILKDGSKGTDSPTRRRVRAVLVTMQMALALMLTAGFSVAFLSIRNLGKVELGFKTENRATFAIQPSPAKHKDRLERLRVAEDVLAGLRALPGVESAGFINLMPAVQSGSNGGFKLHHRETDNGTDIAEIRVVSTGIFNTLSVPILRGHDFGPAEYAAPSNHILISEAFARKYFQDRDPIGQEVYRNGSWNQVVGVVGDLRNNGPRNAGQMETLYFPDVEYANPEPINVVLKTQRTGKDLFNAVREVVQRVDVDLPIMKVQALDELVGQNLTSQRVQTFLLGLFAAIATTLAILGIYSSMSYSVAQRTQEIGIRMALGARPGQVVVGILKEGFAMGGIGIAVGLVGTVAFSSTLKGLIFEVSPTNPIILLGASLVLLATAAFAAFIPARRAALVDPTTALRSE